MFTGREYVSTFGIYEYRNRAYHPGLGRFTSEDPKGFDAGDYNLFRYCHNDPEDLTDPMGLFGDQTADKASLENAQQDQQQVPQDFSLSRIQLRDSIQDAFGVEVGKAIEQAINQGNTYAQNGSGPQGAASKVPDPSLYAPGEPYKAERYVENHWSWQQNGKLVDLTDFKIQAFDKNGPLAGVDVTEPSRRNGV